MREKPGPTQDEIQKFSDGREKHTEYWTAAAEIINEQRPAWKRILSVDETTAIDVAHGEARLIDQNIDYLVDRRGLDRTEAEAEVFRKVDDSAIDRARRQPELVRIGRELAKRYVAGDSEALGSMRDWTRSFEEQQAIIDAARPIVLEQVINTLRHPGKEGTGSIGHKLSDFEIQRGDIPEQYLETAQKEARQWLRTIADIPMVFRYDLLRLEANGIIDRQEDFLHSPETQVALAHGLEHACEWNDPKRIGQAAELLAESQMTSGDRADTVLTSKHYDLIAKHLAQFPEPVEQFFNGLLQAKVATAEQSPVFLEKVKEMSTLHVLNSLTRLKKHSYGSFDQKTVEYVTAPYEKAGIFRVGEILEKPEIEALLAV